MKVNRNLLNQLVDIKYVNIVLKIYWDKLKIIHVQFVDKKIGIIAYQI